MGNLTKWFSCQPVELVVFRNFFVCPPTVYQICQYQMKMLQLENTVIKLILHLVLESTCSRCYVVLVSVVDEPVGWPYGQTIELYCGTLLTCTPLPPHPCHKSSHRCPKNSILYNNKYNNHSSQLNSSGRNRVGAKEFLCTFSPYPELKIRVNGAD